MNKKLAGIALVITGIASYLLPLSPIPNIGSCTIIGIPASLDLGCVVINAIPALVVVAIGAFLIYKNK